jgi:hypothetical protein
MPVSRKFVLRVEDDGSALLGERLARSLLGDLSRLPDVDVRVAPAEPAAAGAKGAELEPTLVVAVLGGTATARVAPQAIKEWAVTRRRTVRVRLGDQELEVPRGLDEAQERAISRLLGEDRP